jgi:hypothetical protein
MGTISLQNPVIGQPDTTEDVKVQNNFTTLQTVINGNIDTNNLNAAAGIVDTQLWSPNNTVPRLLLTAFGQITGGFAYAGQNFILAGTGLPFASGANASGIVVPFVSASLSWAVAHKTTTAVVQLGVMVNAVIPSINITASLLKISSLGAVGNLSITGSLLAGSTTAVNSNPAAGSATSVVSSPFTLPVDGGSYVLVVTPSGGSGTVATSSVLFLSANLYAYNA